MDRCVFILLVCVSGLWPGTVWGQSFLEKRAEIARQRQEDPRNRVLWEMAHSIKPEPGPSLTVLSEASLALLDDPKFRTGLERLGLVEILVAETIAQLRQPTGRLHRLLRFRSGIRQLFGLDPGEVYHREQELLADLEEFQAQKIPQFFDELTAGKTFEDILSESPRLGDILDQFQLPHRLPAAEEEWLADARVVLQALRRFRNDTHFRELSQIALGEELEAAISDSSHLRGEKRKIWRMYRDVFDPRDEWFVVSDKVSRFVGDEVLINAPLLLLSGLGRDSLGSVFKQLLSEG